MENIVENKYEDSMKMMVSRMNRRLDTIYKGGGEKKIAKHKAKGKLTARERIDYLTDDDSEFIELGAFAGFEMYEDHGGCPGGGVVTGIGHVSGRQCVIIANDATVKAGAFFPITGKKNLRAQEIAMENRLPIIYLVDSAGVYLPMQDEIFPDKEHFGRVFRNNAQMSSMGITQISAIMGSCVAGGAYLPIMSDESLIVEGTGSIFLAGPYLVKAAIGETADKETLGGAKTQTEISGVVDYKLPDDESCLDKIKELMSQLGPNTLNQFDRVEPKPPKVELTEIYRRMPDDRAKPYKARELLKCLVDDSKLSEYKAGYAKTMILSLIHI